MELGYIPADDGFTERGWVERVPGLYPRVELSWRPMCMEELAAYANLYEKLQGMKRRELVAGLMAGKIRSWDLRNPVAGKTVEINEAELLRVKEQLFFRLWGVVTGDKPADGLLDRHSAETSEDCQALVEAAKTGRSLAEVKEARARKNSLPASAS